MLNLRKCEEEQKKLASKVVLADGFSEISTIGGAEVYVVDKRMVACVVVCDAKTLSLKEKSIVSGVTSLTFHPEFRAYREGPLLGEAISGLSLKPDVMMFDGEGVLHPRLGLASHLGVLFDMPSLGVLKEPSFGEIQGSYVVLEGKKLGQLVRTKEHANPLVVSAGHKITLESAVTLVKKSILEPHKMPEPLHLAHKLAKKGMITSLR